MPRAYFEGECPYDPARTDLLDDVDAIVELLALQHRMQMREKDVEMLLTVAVGHDDGDGGAGPCSLAVGRHRPAAGRGSVGLCPPQCSRAYVPS